MALEIVDQPRVVLAVVLLGQQDLVLGAVPAPSPVFVRPDEAEGEIERAVLEQLFDRALEYAPVR